MLEKNKVLITGILGFLVLTLQQFVLVKGETDWKVIGLAALIGILGVVGNSWKMQGITITGIVGTVSYAAYEVYNAGFNWNTFIATALIALLTTFMTKYKDKEPPSPDSLTNKPA